jgi:hypothetical protein
MPISAGLAAAEPPAEDALDVLAAGQDGLRVRQAWVSRRHLLAWRGLLQQLLNCAQGTCLLKGGRGAQHAALQLLQSRVGHAQHGAVLQQLPQLLHQASVPLTQHI